VRLLDAEQLRAVLDAVFEIRSAVARISHCLSSDTIVVRRRQRY
jgi:hypothetical protein